MNVKQSNGFHSHGTKYVNNNTRQRDEICKKRTNTKLKNEIVMVVEDWPSLPLVLQYYCDNNMYLVMKDKVWDKYGEVFLPLVKRID